MFDLITQSTERPLRERSLPSKIVAIVVHTTIIAALLVIPLLRVADQLPAVVPTVMAFVAPAPVATPPPPPPPPAPAVARQAAPVRTASPDAAPVEAPAQIAPEPPASHTADAAGVLGGVEGGVPGGVVGGVLGGLVTSAAPPPPPPPPPPPVARGPVRIGGQIKSPALVKRVEPVYPEVAAVAQLSGIVILEATVNTDGCVEAVKVLRSRHPLLDKASEEALMQWRYSPLVLNGIQTPFVLTVTFTFSVK